MPASTESNLRGPFYRICHRYGTAIREEDERLERVLYAAKHGSESGDHYVEEIGDADGWLWRMLDPFAGWEASERAPRPEPYDD